MERSAPPALNESRIYSPLASASSRAALAAEDRLYGRERETQQILVDDELFELFVDDLVNRVLDGKDNVIMIDGLKRLGKSTAGLRIGNRFLEKVVEAGILRPRRAYMGHPLDLERDVVYRLDKFLGRVEHGVSGEVVLSDEGVLVAQSSAGKSRAIQALERALSICGRLNLTLIVLAPSLEELAKVIRGSVLADYWLHAESRGDMSVRYYRPTLHFKPHNTSDFFKLKAPRDHLYWQPFRPDDPYWLRYESLSEAAKREGIRDSRVEAEFLRRRALGED